MKASLGDLHDRPGNQKRCSGGDAADQCSIQGTQQWRSPCEVPLHVAERNECSGGDDDLESERNSCSANRDVRCKRDEATSDVSPGNR